MDEVEYSHDSDLNSRVAAATIELAELKSRYHPIDVTENAIIMSSMVTDSPPKNNSSILREYGSTGQSMFSNMMREDYNPELRGERGLRLMDRMRKSDGQIRGTLRLVKTPVVAARWYIEPASNKKRDQKIAKFVWDNLTKWMSVSWPQTLNEALLMLDFGYYMFEKVFDKRDGQIVWRKFAPRHPLDVFEWDWDAHGGPKGVWLHQGVDARDDVYIPIWKLAIFTFDKEGGDITGTSVLRSAYQHWFFKQNLYKIDAIQKERHGIGIPIIVLPPNFNKDDKLLAGEIGRNLRTNERSHVILPPNWEINMLKLEGNAVDALKSAEHHNTMIANNILAPFLGSTGSTGPDQDLFFRSTRMVADIIRDVFNKYCIPQLVDWNWNVDEYPELRVRRIGDTVDWRTISFAIRNFTGAGILVPDDDLEAWVRDEMDLPRANEESRRVIVTPKNKDAQDDMGIVMETEIAPGAGGSGASSEKVTRQSNADKMKQQAQGSGKTGSVGNDTSGGK